MSKKSIFICDWCKKEFEEWTYRQPRFCSNQCRSEFACRQPKPNSHRQSRGGIVRWNCKQCGKEMKTFKSRVRDTCSNKCGKLFYSKAERTTYKCQVCGKETIATTSYIRLFSPKCCSVKCSGEYRLGMFAGDKNPNWKGGTARQERGVNWSSQSKKARRRDNYTCQSCGNLGINVHHIKPYRLFNGDWQTANVLSNLITLCTSCHSKIEHGKMNCPTPK